MHSTEWHSNVCLYSATSGTKCVLNSQNVRSPKLRSPKELSPGIPRRPTAPQEPEADSSRSGTMALRYTGRSRVPRRRGNTASQAPQQQQQQPGSVQRRKDVTGVSTANRHSVTVNSRKFAQSQMQVT